MWGVSQRFIDTLSRSHERRAFVDVLHDGVIVATLDSATVKDPATGSLVQSIGGSVQVARTAVRRSGTVDFLDIGADVTVTEALDLFQPLVTEIRPWVGLKYWDAPAVDLPGTTSWEYVPVGTLVVSGIDTSSYPQISVQGYDRMWMVGPFTQALSLPVGTSVLDAMNRILGGQIPGSRLDTSGIVGTENVTSALLYAEQDDAVQALADMAAVSGQVLYVDPLGVFTTAAEASTDDTPVMSYAPGPRSMMMRPSRTVDASQAYNAVVYTGEGSQDPPVRGYAQDDNPDSATYVGRVGIRPYFASSPLITTTDQATLAAHTRLLNILGIPDTITVPVIPNPALEVGDVITVTDPSQGIDYPVIIDSFPAALRASDGDQELICRSRAIR